jgi:hypothetical protein
MTGYSFYKKIRIIAMVYVRMSDYKGIKFQRVLFKTQGTKKGAWARVHMDVRAF